MEQRRTAKAPRPTDGELEILAVLWQRGPSTVCAVQETLSGSKQVGYTTVLKLMQIMHGKGLLARDESQRTHVYRAKARKETTQRQLIGDLMSRAFGGSPEQLVLQALSAKRASKEELAEIRRLINELEGTQQ